MIFNQKLFLEMKLESLWALSIDNVKILSLNTLTNVVIKTNCIRDEIARIWDERRCSVSSFPICVPRSRVSYQRNFSPLLRLICVIT